MSDIITNYKNDQGTELGLLFVDKSYLIDRYPDLAGTFKQAGLWTWGANFTGQLGDNTLIRKSSPVQTIAGGTNWQQVAVSDDSSIAAIKTDGTLWGWGGNSSGQLGDNTTISKSSPIQTIAGGTNWKQVSLGFYCAFAIKTDGTLWGWGFNSSGQLGDNTTIGKSSPIQTIAGGTNWAQVSAGTIYTAAIKTDGTLWTWGRGTDGQLGDNTAIPKSSPIQTIAGGTNWKQVSAGGYVTAAIKTDGTLWIWGRNGDGQLGDNTTITKSSPVQTITAGTNWKQVSAGGYVTAAIKTDGTLWIWGRNGDGQLGDNTTIRKSSPVQTVAGGTNWKQVSISKSNSSAIKTDGTLWIWGNNYNGSLGDNTTINKSSPVQTITGGTNWKQVACGNRNLACIRDDSADPL